MSRDLEDINASSRSEMVCPECWERGLAENKKRARAYSSEKEKIIHASGCRTDGCKHNHKTGKPIPAKVIEMQLGAGRSFDPRKIVARAGLKTVGVVIGIGLLGFALLIAINGIPFLSDSGGGGVASAESNLTKQDGSISEIWSGSNWTIFKYGDQYVVSGTDSDGDTIYLDESPESVQDAFFFDSEQSAREAIDEWNNIAEQSPNSTIDPDAKTVSSPDLESPWAVFEIDGDYVIAAENEDGNVVFLHPDGSVQIQPYKYDSKPDAEQIILEWNIENLPTDLYSETTASEIDSTVDTPTLKQSAADSTVGDGISGGEEETVPEGSSTTSSITASVSGIVTNQDGDPVKGALVKLHSSPKTTTTNADGEYEFSNVTSGEHTLYALPPEDLNSSLAVPQSTTLNIDTTGDINVTDEPSTLSYFTDSDGSVARNELTYTLPTEQPIRVVGNGSEIKANITFLNSVNANDAQINLSSVTTSAAQDIDWSGSGSNNFKIAGNTQPINQALNISSESSTNSKSITKPLSSPVEETIEIDGNIDPTGKIRIPDNYQIETKTRSQSYSDTPTIHFNNDGTLPTQDETLTLTGKYGTAYQKSDGKQVTDYDDHSEQDYLASASPEITLAKYTDVSGDYYINVEAESGYSGGCANTWNDNRVVAYVTDNSSGGWYDNPNRLFYEGSCGHGAAGEYAGTVHLESDEYVVVSSMVSSGSDHSVYASVSGNAEIKKNSGKVNISLNEKEVATSQHLTEGETQTIHLPEIKKGSNTLSLDTHAVGYKFSFKERYGIRSPMVKHDGQTICGEIGVITSPLTCDIPNGYLNSGEETFSFDLEDGKSNYTIEYTEKYGITDAEISVNGDTYTYPEDFGGSGPINETLSLNISSLTLGENTITTNVPEAGENTPELNTSLKYTGSRVSSYQPEITVIAPDGTTNTKQVPESKLDNGRLTSETMVDIPANWFGDGQNKIIVKTADDSFVKAELDAGGLQYQAERFNRTTANATG